MNGSATKWSSLEATTPPAMVVQRQIEAMGSRVFEIGLYNPNARDGESVMIPRIWDAETIAKAVPWLRFQNREGRNIYVRPRGEHDLSMIDDLTMDALSTMKAAGFDPAVVVETSPGNYQAWLKHPAQLSREMSTAAARKLAEEFAGDRGAADWRHFGRLSGFTNRKPQYFDSVTGLYPYVRLIEATGRVYPGADRFLADLKRDFARRQAEREHLKRYFTHAAIARADLKGIDVFRAAARYGGDGTRVDLAFAVYALSHDAAPEDVADAIRSRDLSHKGNLRRQDEYVQRTIKKAQAALDRGR